MLSLIKNIRAASDIWKKVLFYKKGHLKYHHPIFKPSCEDFTTKIKSMKKVNMLDIAWRKQCWRLRLDILVISGEE